ncbi:MAG: type II toxin-antitoxin system RelE/ParE family toxin [Pseudomonadota bacterium]
MTRRHLTTYDITKKADADLQEIIRHTIERWGVKQARHYVGLLHAGCDSLAKGEGSPKHLIDIDQDLYIARYEHHYILCLKRSDKRPRILAFFHEHMDIITRIKNRL